MESKTSKNINQKNISTTEKCGIIMPISTIDGCNEQHWKDVKEILTETISTVGYEANIVSIANDVGIIQKTIIQNLYDNPIVVCDVSGKNPNVMFELGMRLAFDKPTIIVKDDKTSYSFDTSPIEHLTYPRDLRFNKIVDFKKELAEKIVATVKKSKEDIDYSTFLKQFGKFTVAKLETTEVSKDEYLIEEIREMKHTMQRFMQKDLYRKQKYIDFDNKDHMECEESIMFILQQLLSKMELSDIKSLSNPKMMEILSNSVAHNNMMPSCFDFENNLCREKIYESIKKISAHNN